MLICAPEAPFAELCEGGGLEADDTTEIPKPKREKVPSPTEIEPVFQGLVP